MQKAAIHIQLVIDTGLIILLRVWNVLLFTVFDLGSEFNGLLNAIKILDTGSESIAGMKDQERRIDETYMSVTKEILLSDMDYRGVILTIRIPDSLEKTADTCKGYIETINIFFCAKRV